MTDEQDTNWVGPSGGTGGKPFSTEPKSGSICKIVVRHGSRIDAVGVAWTNDPDDIETHGGTGGTLDTIELGSDEVVVDISGRRGSKVDSLVIRTNKSVYDYGGGGGGSPFHYSIVPGLVLAGFNGRAGSEVDAIGMLLQPHNSGQALPPLFKHGPSGGTGGVEFEDVIPPGARLSKITIRHGSRVDAIGISYEPMEGGVIDLPLHGGEGGEEDTFSIDPGDFLVGISGRYGSRVDSITLHTYKGSSRTYGENGGSADFSYRLNGMEVVGFHGHSGSELDAVGPIFRRNSEILG